MQHCCAAATQFWATMAAAWRGQPQVALLCCAMLHSHTTPLHFPSCHSCVNRDGCVHLGTTKHRTGLHNGWTSITLCVIYRVKRTSMEDQQQPKKRATTTTVQEHVQGVSGTPDNNKHTRCTAACRQIVGCSRARRVRGFAEESCCQSSCSYTAAPNMIW